MKPLKEIIELFPEQSYSEVIRSRFRKLKNRATTDDQRKQIDDIEAVHVVVADFFDNSIEHLKNTIKEYSEYNIEDLEAEELENILNEYKVCISKLENVDIDSPDFENAKNALNSHAASITNTYGNKRNTEKRSSIARFALSMVNSIKLKPFLDGDSEKRLSEALSTAKKLSKQSDKIESAVQVAESLLETREGLIKGDVSERIEYLKEQANSHKGVGIWLWFLAGAVTGTVAVGVLFGLIHGIESLGIEAASEDISFGGSMLRIGLVSVILYFSFYCIKQFTIHRHLAEMYTFKELALQVMLNLRDKSDVVEKQLILAKGLEAIFNEPATGQVQQRSDHSGDYWQSVQRILERLVTKNSDPS